MNKNSWLLVTLIGLASQSLASGIKHVENAAPSEVQTTKSHLKHIISEGITKFEQTPIKDWSYEITRYENEEGDVTSSVELFDPTKGRSQQWSLLRINDQLPTPKQKQTFVENQLKKSNADEHQHFSMQLNDIIQIKSLQLISEGDDQLTASFGIASSQFDKDATKYLRGLIVFDKRRLFITSLEINNIKTFSPVFTAKISDFKLTYHFIKIDDAILLKQRDLSMKGTFGFFTEIDEVSTDTFSAYCYKGS